MNYTDARKEVLDGAKARRQSWQEERHLRKGNLGDRDFINFDDIENIIVDDCPKRHCDCDVCIYNPNEADQLAEDWELVK